jgi:hypothetical protein
MYGSKTAFFFCQQAVIFPLGKWQSAQLHRLAGKHNFKQDK